MCDLDRFSQSQSHIHVSMIELLMISKTVIDPNPLQKNLVIINVFKTWSRGIPLTCTLLNVIFQFQKTKVNFGGCKTKLPILEITRLANYTKYRTS